MEKYLRALESMGYEIEWMVEQERDMPLRWRFLKVERPTMRELVADPRMWEDPRALTVMFSKCAPENRPAPKPLREERLGASPVAAD